MFVPLYPVKQIYKISKDMEITKDVLNDFGELCVIKALTLTAQTAGEISQKKAFATYGRRRVERWIAEGRLKPVRIGNGRTGTIRYSIADILAIKASEAITAATLSINKQN